MTEHERRSAAAENPADFLSDGGWQRASARVAEVAAGGRALGNRERPLAGAMALASGYAAMPGDGGRPMGSPHRSADQADGPVPLCVYREHLVALHGFIKKSRATPDEDLALARKRQKELMR